MIFKNKKLTIAIVIALICILFAFIAVTLNLGGIRQIIAAPIRAYQRNSPKLVLPETKLEDEEDAWYTKYRIVSHSGGGIDGKISTNSVEAWLYAYSRGNRVFDADLRFTSDGVLVLRHEWSDDLEQRADLAESPPTYTEFMDTPIHMKYTPQSCAGMLTFLADHPDAYVSCDSKNDIDKVFTYLVDIAMELGIEHVLDRIIVSMHTYENYKEISNIYSFSNWTFRQYSNFNYYDLAEFCLANNIHVVMVWSTHLDAGDDITVLTDKGIHVYGAVYDRLTDMEHYIDMGVTGFVSNWIYEDDMVYIIE